MSSGAVDVLIVGGGPAGASCAARLARAGVAVRVLERERFPRFHIGESLLPAAIALLGELGIELAGAFLRKRGAVFVDEAAGARQLYDFAEALPGPPRFAYQVERSELDALLLARARELGAEVCEGETVTAVELGDAEVATVTARGRHVARYVIDATGQPGLLGRQLRSLIPIEELGRAAAFAHAERPAPEVSARLHEHGDILVLRTPTGWAWVIPLLGDKISVGVVGRGTVRPRTLTETLEASPLLREHTGGAELGPVRLASNYSMRNGRPHGVRYACIGDAGCFLDPIFSTGVTLALASARSVADRLIPALDRGEEADPELMRPHAEHMRTAFRTFYSLVYRFYHTGLLGNILLSEVADPDLRRGLISILAGDVWREGNPFSALLSQASKTQAPAEYW